MSASIPTYPDLAGKVAVVTGGSKGIGAATSVLLGHNRARVAVCGRDPETIERVDFGDARGRSGRRRRTRGRPHHS